MATTPQFDTNVFTVTVNKVNSPPLFPATGPFTIAEGTPFTLPLPAMDNDLPARP
jgi:hypothetical protein